MYWASLFSEDIFPGSASTPPTEHDTPNASAVNRENVGGIRNAADQIAREAVIHHNASPTETSARASNVGGTDAVA